MLQIVVGLVFPAGVVDAMKELHGYSLKLLRPLHNDLHGVHHPGDGTVKCHIEVIGIQFGCLLPGNFNAVFTESSVVRGIAHKFMLHHSNGFSMADQMDGFALHLRNNSACNVVNLTGLLVNGDTPLQQVLCDSFLFSSGNGGNVKHVLFPFSLLFFIQNLLNLFGQAILNDILIHRLGHHVYPVLIRNDLLPDLGAAHLLFPVIEKNDGTVTQRLQPVQLLIAPLVINGKERGGAQRHIVVKNLGPLDGIGYDLKILPLDTCLQQRQLHHVVAFVISKGIGSGFASVRVHLFPDQGCIFGGRDAHDQFLALFLGKQGIVQVVIVEQLKSAVNKT